MLFLIVRNLQWLFRMEAASVSEGSQSCSDGSTGVSHSECEILLQCVSERD